MTYISAAKLRFTRFENYLAGVFHPIPEEQVLAGVIQSVYGWVFPFLRNAFICGVLKYLADASASVMLQTLAIIAYGVLVAYCFSYVIAGALTPFHFVKYRRLGVLLDGLVTLAVLSFLGYAIFVGTRFTIDEIARGHVESRSNAPRSSPGP
jgi:hypothetical protein